MLCALAAVVAGLTGSCRPKPKPIDDHPDPQPRDGGSTAGDASADGDCAADPATPDSIEAARTRLAGGATETNVSPGSCVRYTVSAQGTTTTEQLSYGGKVAERLVRTQTTAQHDRDADLDGFFEWRSHLTKGANPDGDKLVTEQYVPATQKLTMQRTYTREGDLVHVLVETPDASGTLEELWHFDIPSRQADDPPRGAPVSPGRPAARALAGGSSSGCSAADETNIRARLKEALDGDGTNPGGLVCLHRLGASAKEKAVIAAYMRPLDIFCDPTQDLMAYYDTAGWFDATQRTEIHVNPDKFNRLTPHEQRHLMFQALHQV